MKENTLGENTFTFELIIKASSKIYRHSLCLFAVNHSVWSMDVTPRKRFPLLIVIFYGRSSLAWARMHDPWLLVSITVVVLNEHFSLFLCQEHFTGNREIVVEAKERKETVYIFKCVDSGVQVKGKINSIVLGAFLSILGNKLIKRYCRMVRLQSVTANPTSQFDLRSFILNCN